MFFRPTSGELRGDLQVIVRLTKRWLFNSLRLLRDRFVLEREAARNPTCRIDPRCFIRIHSGCTLKLGESVSIGAYTLLSVEHDPMNPTLVPAQLEIGSHTYIGEMNNIRAAGITRIGAHCLIAQGVSIIGSNHAMEVGLPMGSQPSRQDKLGVVLEDDVWIGANACILPGVTIGRGAVVAAGSVVTRSVAPYTIVAGIPAKVIKHRVEPNSVEQQNRF